MTNKMVNLIVFSQSTALSDMAAIIQRGKNGLPYLCLSTHELFDLEQNQIKELAQKEIYFTCFADFLTDSEMSWCDTYAYDLDSKENGSKIRSSHRYYQYLKREKNKLVLRNLKKQYQLAEKYLCADDLGIAAQVWLEEGFSNHVQQKPEPLSAVTKPTKSSNRLLRLFQNLNIQPKASVLQTPVENYIFLGSVTRITAHLDNVKIEPLQPGFMHNLAKPFLILISKINHRLGQSLLSRLQKKIMARHSAKYGVSTFLSSKHEYRTGHTELAESLKKDLVILQDGFMPENYASKYLAFYFGIREFWVWDRLSLGLFQNQGLKAKVGPFFAVPKLPKIEKEAYPIKTILVLTSGSGDWTALKNRSDEDKMVTAFVKVAEHFPQIQIIYRCHPLWAHPKHQGINSIHRVGQYFREKSLKNITLSGESLTLSEKFMQNGVMGFPRSSLEQDLKKADLVFGEHSFTMISAARRGILFASVNLTKRRDLLLNYSKLGFPHLTSTEELIAFIEELQISPADILGNYNQAVECYNTQWLR